MVDPLLKEVSKLKLRNDELKNINLKLQKENTAMKKLLVEMNGKLIRILNDEISIT